MVTDRCMRVRLRDIPDVAKRRRTDHVDVLKTYLLCHRHAPRNCPVAFAAWKGCDSPLRHRPALASCATGGHAVWWTVVAADEGAALAHLPPYVARTTEVVPVREVTIP